jgi:hypothetical protein
MATLPASFPSNSREIFGPEELAYRGDVYEVGYFFPICIGDTFNKRYIVLGKLGFGGTSK